MFDLNREIDGWCREIIEQNCAGREHLEELKDHLHCLVEAQRARGVSEQASFRAALEQMGDSALIADAYRSNTTLLQKMAAFDRRISLRLEKRYSAQQLSRALLGWSVLCAVLMIAAAALAPDTGLALSGWLIALWLIPFSAIAATPSIRAMECRWFRRIRDAIGA